MAPMSNRSQTHALGLGLTRGTTGPPQCPPAMLQAASARLRGTEIEIRARESSRTNPGRYLAVSSGHGIRIIAEIDKKDRYLSTC